MKDSDKEEAVGDKNQKRLQKPHLAPTDGPFRIPGVKAQKSVVVVVFKSPDEFIDGQLEGQESSMFSCSREVRRLEGKARGF